MYKGKLSLMIISLLYYVLEPMALAERQALFSENGDFLPHVRLAKDLIEPKRYDNRVRPVINHTLPTRVSFSMSLYQILAINEKMQNIDLNVWVIQKWHDDFLGWNPRKYGLINSTILPYNLIWLPDTYVYNSVVMNREETERYINVVVDTKYWENKRGAQIKFMYPALYRTSCRIQIQFFPYDQQNCTLIISSWTNDRSSMDYVAEFESVNLENFIPNEEWVIESFNIRRIEEKFVCCETPWVLLEASLVVRRKPLYYIVNLVIPTSVITLVAVTGFFTPASTSNERREKLSLGIDSLLAMSILMMMVSEQMPTTSDYIPLFGLFYLLIIFIIFIGTLFTAFILNVHLQKIYNKPVPPLVAYIFFHKVAPFLSVQPSTTLLELWMDTGVHIRGLISSLKRRNRPNRKHFQRSSKAEFDESSNVFSNDDNQRFFFDVSSTLKDSNFTNLSASKQQPDTWTRQSSKSFAFQSSKKSQISEPSRKIIPVEQKQRSSSATARENWRRVRASIKRRNEMVQRQSGVSPTFTDIPFVDISPGRISLAPLTTAEDFMLSDSRKQSISAPVQLQLSTLLQQNKPSFSNRSIDLLQQTPKNFGRVKHISAANNIGSFSTAMPTIFSSINAATTATNMGVDDAAFNSKMRRRFAHEWEYLASVLDRLLLIVFSGLVVLVTAGIMIIGEMLHFSYDITKSRL